MGMALKELAAADVLPMPVLAPIPAPAPATIHVALTGWSPSTIPELEAACVSEVSMDPRELVYMPAPAPVPVHAPPPLWRRPRAFGCTRRARARARAPLNGMGRCR